MGGALVAGRGSEEVAAHARPQVVRLADVENAASLVLKEVHARLVRELAAHFLRGAGEELGLRFGELERRLAAVAGGC